MIATRALALTGARKQADFIGNKRRKQKHNTETSETKMNIKQTLVSAVTQYDAKQSKRAGFNRYALPQYLMRIDEVANDIQQGANTREAITAAFTGRLLDVCLRAVGETTSTRNEQRGTGWTYIPASNLNKANTNTATN